MTDLESGFRIADLLDLLRRRSAIVLGGAIVGLIVGYLAFAGSPPNYSATARVQVRPFTADPLASGSSDGEKVDIGTEKELVKADAVGDAVRAELDLPGDNRALFRTLTVSSKEDSLVFELTVESSSAAQARDTANAVAAAYQADRQRAASAVKDRSLTRIEQQLTDARAAVAEANDALEATESGSAARSEAQALLQQAQQSVNDLVEARSTANAIDTESVVDIVRLAPLPTAVLSKMALAKGVGVFGLFVVAGLGVALLVDRRDSLGGGRRRVQELAPNANIRIMPTAVGTKASPAEIDAAIDRLAVELAGGGSRGRATAVLVAGTRTEPPVAMAEELASSLTFAGIPALFVLAGTTDRDVRQAHVVVSFSDLITGPSITGPASLPDVAGAGVGVSAPTVTWLRPRGSAEASGLLRRAVVEALITRAGREGFEAVVFVAATPTRNAAAAALGQWVAKTAVIVEDDDGPAVEQAVSALREADVAITEVVWT